MSAITCPICTNTAEPAATAGAVAVCGVCGASLFVGGDEVRRATGEETLNLSAGERRTLQHARGRLARPERL